MVPFCQRPWPLLVGRPSALRRSAMAWRDMPAARIACSHGRTAALGSGIAGAERGERSKGVECSRHAERRTTTFTIPLISTSCS